MKTNILRVAGSSNVSSLAGSIVKSIEDNKQVELHSIGASSVNQACKAIASASGILATKGYQLLTRLGFDDVEINGETRTMMKFRLIIK